MSSVACLQPVLDLRDLSHWSFPKCRELLDADGVSVQLLDEERDEHLLPILSSAKITGLAGSIRAWMAIGRRFATA
jgi:hypothetical protein